MSDHDVALVQQFLRIVDAQGSATDRGVLIFLSLRLAAVIETPRYDLTLFKVHFGNLTLKANTNGEHVLRFEVVVHNTKQLRCGRVLDRFTEITGRLAGMVDRFATTQHHLGHPTDGLEALGGDQLAHRRLVALPHPPRRRDTAGVVPLHHPAHRLHVVPHIAAAPR